MRRILTVLVLLAMVAPAVAGADYFAELATAERTADIRVDGDYYWTAVEDGTRFTVTYDTVLINDAYNTTTLDAFELYVRDGSGVIATTELETGEVTDLAGVDGIVRFTVPATATELTRFGFTANHTATLSRGGTVERTVDGWVPLDITIPPVTFHEVATNASAAVRGGDIFVNGTVENADGLRVGNRTLEVRVDGRFSGWLPVPVDIGTGEQPVTYRFTTDRGSRENVTLTVPVVNVPPSLSVETPSPVQRGAGTRIDYTAVDETPGLNVTATLGNRTVEGRNGQIRFEPVTIRPGNHTVTVTATDLDGATNSTAVPLEVLPAPDQDPDDDGDGTPLPEEDPLGFAQAFIDFVVGFFVFLIPGI